MASNPVFAILWMLLLFFIAWPVAWFCAGLWIFLQVWRWGTNRTAEIYFFRTLAYLSLFLLYNIPFLSCYFFSSVAF
jgi:hypothetical protein